VKIYSYSLKMLNHHIALKSNQNPYL